MEFTPEELTVLIKAMNKFEKLCVLQTEGDTALRLGNRFRKEQLVGPERRARLEYQTGQRTTSQGNQKGTDHE